LGHCQSRTRREHKSKRGQGGPKRSAPRAHFSLSQASFNEIDLPGMETTNVARLMQEVQALAEKFCVRFLVARFSIG
jgi:hypothetical protein